MIYIISYSKPICYKITYLVAHRDGTGLQAQGAGQQAAGTTGDNPWNASANASGNRDTPCRKSQEMEIDELPVWHHPRLPHIVPQRDDIEEMAAHLETGKRITLFCGAGCEGAHEEVV